MWLSEYSWGEQMRTDKWMGEDIYCIDGCRDEWMNKHRDIEGHE